LIKAKKLLVPLLVLATFLGTASPVLGNYRFFSTVQMVCSAYRINVNYEDMNLLQIGDGKEEFSLTLQSARNDFDRIMLIGFYAAGKAVLKYNEPVGMVNMIIDIEFKGTEKIFASASSDDILKYVNSEISSSQFMRRIKFN